MNEICAKRMKLTFGIESPCMECQERKPACHDSCERYREYKAKVDEVKGRKREADRKEQLVHPGLKRSKGKWSRK